MGAEGVRRGAGVALGADFARALPELAVPWQATRWERLEILAVNEDLARELGLDPEWLLSEAGARFLLGDEVAKSASPVAQAYAGHQFGGFNPRLGDGRALLLGELNDTEGGLRDLHLKGSGPTPFSRGDGFAALGPMLRELLMGEAMHSLGVPTTRALAVASTGRWLARNEYLDPVPGAVLVRIAASHLRVGTFQYARISGDTELLRRLADYAIERHYPELAVLKNPYLGLLNAVIEVQAKLVAHWMLLGFVHGVMNTDNMTISGETIDYGPCAFIDAYDPAAVFSSIDRRGRYAYGKQASIAQWNLARFAEAVLPLLSEDPNTAQDAAREALANFGPIYEQAWLSGMRGKLGLGALPVADFGDAALSELIGAMLGELRQHGVDYTRFFRVLADAARGREDELRGMFGVADGVDPRLIDSAALGDWFEWWLELSPDADAMDTVNPVYIPRNHLVDEALMSAMAGDLALFERILEAVTNPFAPREGFERYALPPSGERGRFVTYCGT